MTIATVIIDSSVLIIINILSISSVSSSLLYIIYGEDDLFLNKVQTCMACVNINASCNPSPPHPTPPFPLSCPRGNPYLYANNYSRPRGGSYEVGEIADIQGYIIIGV